MTERTIALDLEVGRVAIVLDCFQGWGPSGMVFSGEDQILSTVTEVIPSTASSSEVNEDGELHWEISCGSDGEVAQGISSLLHRVKRRVKTSSWRKDMTLKSSTVCEVWPRAERVFWCLCMPNLQRPLEIGIV